MRFNGQDWCGGGYSPSINLYSNPTPEPIPNYSTEPIVRTERCNYNRFSGVYRGV
jgi:hypothetical protein